jgi:hypothetical protein
MGGGPVYRVPQGMGFTEGSGFAEMLTSAGPPDPSGSWGSPGTEDIFRVPFESGGGLGAGEHRNPDFGLTVYGHGRGRRRSARRSFQWRLLDGLRRFGTRM